MFQIYVSSQTDFSATGSKMLGKLLKMMNEWNLKDFIIIGAAQELMAQHGSAQLSLFLWWFIKNNWPNDKATHCTTISSAVVAVIGKKLGSEEKVIGIEGDFKLN